jgi:uncharacterized protein YrrD
MLVSYKSMLGKTVLDMDRGTVLGEVGGLLLDPGHQTVGAVILSDHRAFRLDAIHSFGRDAIMVNLENARDEEENRQIVEEFRRIGSVINKSIVSRDGAEIGSVEDVLFDGFSGELQLIVVAGDIFQQLTGGTTYLVADFLRTIGPDHVIAKGGAADAIIKEYSGLERISKRIQRALSLSIRF